MNRQNYQIYALMNPATLCGGGITLAGVLLFNHEAQLDD